jgi:hypothetical protein
MQPRFNPACETFDEIVEYYTLRGKQLQWLGYDVHRISETEFGAVAEIHHGSGIDGYQSIYVANSKRGQNHFRNYFKNQRENRSYPIITTFDCDLVPFLCKNGIPHKVLDTGMWLGYDTISQYYGDKKAERSGVFYMNHIDEGFTILQELGYDLNKNEEVFDAYATHPIFQADEELVKNFPTLHSNADSRMIALTMEYRSVANEYLSKRIIQHIGEIRLSPLKEVNDMLIADKVQNRKDFELYHEGTHPNSTRLAQYFRDWLRKLGVSEEQYHSLKNKLMPNPMIIRM